MHVACTYDGRVQHSSLSFGLACLFAALEWCQCMPVVPGMTTNLDRVGCKGTPEPRPLLPADPALHGRDDPFLQCARRVGVSIFALCGLCLRD